MEDFELITNVVQNDKTAISYLLCGTNNRTEYLKTVQFLKDSINDEFDLYFDNEVPFNVDFKFVEMFEREFEKMDLFNIKDEDILLFQNKQDNSLFVKNLNKIVDIALEKGDVSTITIKDFLTNILLWCSKLLLNRSLHGLVLNKVIYNKANLSKREAYFLLLLHLMNFSVVIFNCKTTCKYDYILTDYFEIHYNSFDLIDNEISSEENSFKTVNSVLYNAKIEVDNMFKENNLYTSWQLKNYNLEVIGINSIFKDIRIYWNTVLKSRNGYLVNDDEHKVFIPRIFIEVLGINDDLEHIDLLNMFRSDENTIIIDNADDLFEMEYDSSNKYELFFTLQNDTQIDIEMVKKLKCYIYHKYENNIQHLIMTKISEFLNNQNMFLEHLTNEELLEILYNLLRLSDNILSLISKFDYANINPKLVYINDSTNNITDKEIHVLMFLASIGFDIVLLNLSGIPKLEKVVNKNYYSFDKLVNINNMSIKELQETKNSKSFFARLFG